jgi:hypothetical protein
LIPRITGSFLLLPRFEVKQKLAQRKLDNHPSAQKLRLLQTSGRLPQTTVLLTPSQANRYELPGTSTPACTKPSRYNPHASQHRLLTINVYTMNVLGVPTAALSLVELAIESKYQNVEHSMITKLTIPSLVITSVKSMKRAIVVPTLDAPEHSVYAQIWRDIAKATSHPKPEVISHARNQAATRITRGKTTCSGIFHESTDDFLLSASILSRGLAVLHRCIRPTRLAIQSASIHQDEMIPKLRTPPSRFPCLVHTTQRLEEEVSPSFRTPPNSFVRTVFRTWRHVHGLILTLCGQSTDRPSVRICCRTLHHSGIHWLGIG